MKPSFFSQCHRLFNFPIPCDLLDRRRIFFIYFIRKADVLKEDRSGTFVVVQEIIVKGIERISR